jgi:preprotein translocase subunit YajC
MMMIAFVAVIAVMGFALVKVRRQRKNRQSSSHAAAA